MNEDSEPDAYVLEAEAFGALRRLVGRLRGEGLLTGDERRNLSNRMNALLQKAQPQHARQRRPTARAENSLASNSSNDGFCTLTSHPFGKM